MIGKLGHFKFIVILAVSFLILGMAFLALDNVYADSGDAVQEEGLEQPVIAETAEGDTASDEAAVSEEDTAKPEKAAAEEAASEDVTSDEGTSEEGEAVQEEDQTGDQDQAATDEQGEADGAAAGEQGDTADEAVTGETEDPEEATEGETEDVSEATHESQAKAAAVTEEGQTEGDTEEPEVPVPSIVLKSDGRFYKDDVLLKNQWIEYDGARYFADPKGYPYRNRFISFGDIYYYMGSDGSVQTGAIKTAAGTLYYSAEDGIVNRKVGWIDYNEKKYFAKAGGELYHDRFITFGEIYYYMGTDGSVQTGAIKTATGALYYSAEDGIVNRKVGWIDYNDKRYFAKAGGELYHDRFISFGDIYYYMGKDGSVQTGIVKTAAGALYYSAEDGIANRKVGWIDYDGKKYFAKAGGELYHDRFITFGEIHYYMGSDGSVQTGMIKTSAGALYYTAEDGVVNRKVGWIDYNDKRYFAKAGGELYHDRFITFGDIYYYMGKDGSVQTGVFKTAAGALYYAAEDGITNRKVGWIEQDGKKYFAKAGGELYHDRFITFGEIYYYMGSDGSVQTGIVRTTDGALYYSAEDGIVNRNVGWIEYNGKKYFAKAGGELYKNRFISFGTTYYYMSEDGSAVSGEQTIAGRTYQFNDDCTLIGFPSGSLKGIDVSEFQGSINWTLVKSSGIEFAFIRAGGRGGTLGKIYDDEKFAANMTGAIANGLKVGVYFFTQAITAQEAVEEANYICDKSAPYEFELPVVIDTESLIIDGEACRHDKISVSQRTAVVKAFCEQVIKRGYTPMIYASTYWLEEQLNMSQLPYKVWAAQYYSECQYEGDYSFWQYTDSGKVNGISGGVDMNLWIS